MAPATTRRTKGEVTRQRILERAAPVFNQRGYAGATMTDLVAATGLETVSYTHLTLPTNREV